MGRPRVVASLTHSRGRVRIRECDWLWPHLRLSCWAAWGTAGREATGPGPQRAAARSRPMDQRAGRRQTDALLSGGGRWGQRCV